MDIDDLVEDLIKGKKKHHHNKWYPGKILFKVVEAILELIGAIITIMLVTRIFELDMGMLASIGGTLVTFIIIRFIFEELS